ncbi:MAG: 1-acyl-sn-glycerol-3-phosphate acyltransferase [Bacilli bacterium]|nr:1-acyl-sn-glycerol-3-phosphate acyltransferase [Bacilli bacterium]
MAKNKKKKENVRAPRYMAFLLTFVSKIYLGLFYKVKIDRKALKEQKRGCFLIYNHYSNKDHYLSSAAVNYRRVNYVISGHFFFNKILAVGLPLARAIKKEQFKPDLMAIRKMRKVIEQNGIVAIAPAGQVSIDGAPIFISKAIVKLIRMCKADVLALRMQGSHLCFPKWRLGKRKCDMNLTFEKVLVAEELENYTDDEIYEKVVKSIGVNEYLDQLEMKRKIKGKNIISGLENVLIKCPKCGSYYTHIASKNTMSCTACGNTVIMDEYGFLKPKTNDDVCFEDETKWYDYQKAELEKELNNSEFSYSAKVRMSNNLAKEKVMEHVSDGVITLTNDRFYYESENYVKEFNYNMLIQLPFSISPDNRVYFEVPDSEGTFSFCPIDERKEVIRFVQYIDIINSKREKE